MATQQLVWLITGSSRGIGFELAKQLLAFPTNTVIATCRNPTKASALQGLKSNGTLHIVALDVTDSESIRKATDEVSAIVGDKGIDYLINNAGVILDSGDSGFEMESAALLGTFAANVVAPAAVSRALLPLVEKSTKKTIVNVSSTIGSIGGSRLITVNNASYAISKAALNMLTYQQSKDRPELTVVSLCPGWLKTDLGGPDAMQSVSEGVEDVIKTVSTLKHEDSGSFVSAKGQPIPW